MKDEIDPETGFLEPVQRNRNKRRDKKRKTKMIVDDGARKLARIKQDRGNWLKPEFEPRWVTIDYGNPDDPYKGRSRPD